VATHRVPLLGSTTLPDSSGSVIWTPWDVIGSNDVWKYAVWNFKDTATDIGLYSTVYLPANYVGSAKVGYIWTASPTSGNVLWGFEYRAIGGDNSESLDQSGTQEDVTVQDAAPGAAFRRLEVTVNLTSGNLAAGDLIQCRIYRDGTSIADDLAGDAYLHFAYLEYSDTA